MGPYFINSSTIGTHSSTLSYLSSIVKVKIALMKLLLGILITLSILLKHLFKSDSSLILNLVNKYKIYTIYFTFRMYNFF